MYAWQQSWSFSLVWNSLLDDEEVATTGAFEDVAITGALEEVATTGALEVIDTIDGVDTANVVEVNITEVVDVL